MALETTAELLDFVQDMSGLPTTNNEMTPTKWYRLMTLAQQELHGIFATHVPQVLYGAPTKLVSSDGGYTYDFTTFPSGRVEVRESRTGRLLRPGAEYDQNADFAIEVNSANGYGRLRWVDKDQRTFEDGPYARYISEPTDIEAGVDPSLQPLRARPVIAWRALEMWAARGRLRDPAHYAREVQKALWGDPTSPGSVGLIPMLKSQFLNQMGQDTPGVVTPWFRSPDLGNHYIA